MSDWKVTLTRMVAVNGAPKALQSEFVIEDTTRNLAIPMGIDELFKRGSEGEIKVIPQEAVDYWNECKTNGGKQLYEIQSELETRWGITYGIQEVGAEPSPPPQPEYRNGATPEVGDLDTMLKNHLKLLQSRNAVLAAELEKKQAEFDRNNADIMRISGMLRPDIKLEVGKSMEQIADEKAFPLTPAVAKKRGRKPKEQPHAE